MHHLISYQDNSLYYLNRLNLEAQERKKKHELRKIKRRKHDRAKKRQKLDVRHRSKKSNRIRVAN